jgi:hypothetical protein
MGGWVGPRVGLDAVEKIKILHCPKIDLLKINYILMFETTFRTE